MLTYIGGMNRQSTAKLSGSRRAFCVPPPCKTHVRKGNFCETAEQ